MIFGARKTTSLTEEVCDFELRRDDDDSVVRWVVIDIYDVDDKLRDTRML